MQHARLPCPSPSLEVCPSSCPLHWWYYPAISSSDIFFSFCLQSFPASETFPMSQLFESDDQNTWVSASASVLPTRIQGWFPSRLTSLSSLLVQGTLRSLLQDHSLKTSILRCTTFFMVQLSQPHVTTWKTIALTIRTIVDRVKSLFCNTAFLWLSSHNHIWPSERPKPWLYGPLLAKRCLCFLTDCLGF